MKTDYSSVTVYIVDDEPDVCRGLERLLRTASYETRSFTSGPEFISAHDPDQPGCVVLDFDLAAPGLDGLKVQSMLAASGCLRPVIFLTGRANIATSVAALRECSPTISMTRPESPRSGPLEVHLAPTRDADAARARGPGACRSGPAQQADRGRSRYGREDD